MKDIKLQEEIAKVAYELYEKSGRVKGHDLDNWLEAEKIVKELYRKPKKLKNETDTLKKRRPTIKKRTTKKAETKAKKTNPK